MARYFVALLPPAEIQSQVNAVKQDFADRFASRKAQNSPPHITLQPPFGWQPEQEDLLRSVLATFAQAQPPLSLQLDGFGAFAPRVIFVKVVSTPTLVSLQQQLLTHLEQELQITDAKANHRPFRPHMTVAFRDLTRQNFQAGWAEYQNRSFADQFTASKLTLLIHNGRCWQINSEFAFATS